jgi:Flp pilus assembly protein TadD
LLRNYAPLVVVLGLYLLARGAVLGGTVRAATQICPLDNIVAHPEYGLQVGESPLLARWGTPVAVFGQAVRLLVWPYPLSWDYSYAAVESVRKWSDPRLWLGIAALAACGVVVARSLRGRWAAVGVGIGFLLVSYSVVSNTFLVIGGVFAERYLYLPSAGFCLLAAGIFGARRSPRSFALAALTIVSLTCAILTVVRNRDFVSQATLNAADLRAQPRSSRLWAAVGGDRLLAGAYGAALQHAERALAIYPENATGWRVAGLAHWRLGRFEPALAALFKSIANGEGDNENTWAAIGSIYVARGEYARAIETLTSFVERHPNAATVLNNLAWYLVMAEPATLRDPARAVDYARHAVALQPTAADFADTYYSALAAAGRPQEARRMLAEALQHIPASDPLYAELVKKVQAP